MPVSGLITDLYALTMMQGYYLHDANPEVVFDMFYRHQPFSGGFSVFAGLDDLLSSLENLQFSKNNIAYLESLGLFKKPFLDFLKDFTFGGGVYAMREGDIVFPGEPLLRIHASLLEAQFIESLVLNTINFQTLIATKAARIYISSGSGKILEFGLRRAQGINGALTASRAAYIGGAMATSNVSAGYTFGIPVSGTMAHSWVMAFGSEKEAFEKYADLYPDNCSLLIDTYDTLGSGIEFAIEVGKSLKKKGHSFGVRLDSGDLYFLSREVRRRLDEAGLEDARITASNDLDEEIIHQLITDGAPIDIWGVGTHLVTGGTASSLSGIYKLAAKKNGNRFVPTIKVSDNPEKTTNPGIKQVYRFKDASGAPLADMITLEDEKPAAGTSHTLYHPMVDYKRFAMNDYATVTPQLYLQMEGGERTGERKDLEEIRDHALTGLGTLNDRFKRIINPHVYKVSISSKLRELKFRMIHEYTGA